MAASLYSAAAFVYGFGIGIGAIMVIEIGMASSPPDARPLIGALALMSGWSVLVGLVVRNMDVVLALPVVAAAPVGLALLLLAGGSGDGGPAAAAAVLLVSAVVVGLQTAPLAIGVSIGRWLVSDEGEER